MAAAAADMKLNAGAAAARDGAVEHPAAVAHTAGVPYLHAAKGLSSHDQGSGVVSNPRSGISRGLVKIGLAMASR